VTFELTNTSPYRTESLRAIFNVATQLALIMPREIIVRSHKGPRARFISITYNQKLQRLLVVLEGSPGVRVGVIPVLAQSVLQLRGMHDAVLRYVHEDPVSWAVLAEEAQFVRSDGGDVYIPKTTAPASTA